MAKYYQNSDFQNGNDLQLWQALKKGNQEAACQLMEKFYQLLYRYGLKLSAGNEALTKDCIQDLFLKLWNTRTQLSEVKVVKPYLLTAFRRRILDAMAAQPPIGVTLELPDEENVSHPEAVTYSYEDFLIRRQDEEITSSRLAQAMNKLSKRQREAVYLRYYENMEYSQIAEVMSLKERSVYNLVHEGLVRLREEFGSIITLLGAVGASLLATLLLLSA